MAHQAAIQKPVFGSAVIQSGRTDGYWVETIKFDSKDLVPGIIASGLASGKIEFLDNPLAVTKKDGSRARASAESAWKKYQIGQFNSPVAVQCVDITGDGTMDVLVCHDYGPFMLECDPKGGWISWLENPGRKNLKDGEFWTVRHIGRWPAMHRMVPGHFTQKSILEVIAASVVRGQHDKVTPIPIIRFQRPENVLDALEWPRDIVDDENFSVIHEVTVRKFDGPSGLDSMLISSREGLTWLHYEDKAWKRDLISAGIPKEWWQSPTKEAPGSGDHWGTGNADAGRVGNDAFAYIATMEPFHGNGIAVYTKYDQGFKTNKWKQHVLDVYGTPNQLKKTGDGPGHFIVCADFDGDGDDEFIVSLFGSLDRDSKGESIKPSGGPNPNKGIMYYKAIDLANGVFAKFKIAEDSSARIALGDFTNNGKIDLVSMKYTVPRYYEEPNPVVTLHKNETVIPKPRAVDASIVATVWAGEGMVYIPDPTEAVGLEEIAKEPLHIQKFRTASSTPLIEIANYRITAEIVPYDASISLAEDEGIKVIYGAVVNNMGTRTPLSTPSFEKVSLKLSGGELKAGSIGAVILRFTPLDHTTTRSVVDEEDDFVSVDTLSIQPRFKSDKTFPTAASVPVVTLLKPTDPRLPVDDLKFNKVDTLWWGAPYKGVDFYNLSGFSFRFLTSKTHIAHLQFWAAGTNVNCGVHNHRQDIFEEVHICLSPGTGNGGMARLKKEYENTKPEDMNSLPGKAFDYLILGPLDEQGGIWARDVYDKCVRRADKTVVYPWHKWQAGEGKDVDVWAAIEFNPDLDFGKEIE